MDSLSTGIILAICFIITSVFFFAVLFLSRTSGRFYTNFTLWRIRRRGIMRPEYEKFEDCSPAEFGVIIDGQCGRDELVAEIIYLVNRGYIGLSGAADGTIAPALLARTPSAPVSDVDKFLLSAIAQGQVPDVTEFKKVVLQSLGSKGWVTTRRFWGFDLADRVWRALGRLSLITRVILLLALIVFGIPFLGFIVLMVSGGVSDPYVHSGASDTLGFFGMLVMFGGLLLLALAIITPVLLVLATPLYVFVQGFKGVTIVARNHSPKYKQHYRDVLGLHQYLSVAGMDTMTPDYEKLDFRGLDPLYPYAIAAGLDGKIVEMFRISKIDGAIA